MRIKEILERELDLIKKIEEAKNNDGMSLVSSIFVGPAYVSVPLLKEILNYKCEILKMLTAIKVKEIEQGTNKSTPTTSPKAE